MNETYKGFNIEYFICRKGFNQYKLTITKYRYKGTKQEEYFMDWIYTTTNKKAVARKEAQIFIDNIKKIEWHSNGMLNCPYVPNRKGLKEEYTIVVDFGKPYTIKVFGKEAVKQEIARIDALNYEQEGDIKIFDLAGKEISELCL